jgi:hypothetical protein
MSDTSGQGSGTSWGGEQPWGGQPGAGQPWSGQPGQPWGAEPSGWQQPPTGGYGTPWPQEPQDPPVAIAALVCGIAGFVLFPILPHIAAVICGAKGRRLAREEPHRYKSGLATAGWAMGLVGLGLAALGVLLVVLFLAAFASFAP